MKPGDHVVCIDDQGWLDPDIPGPPPVKGCVYVIRDAELFGSCLAYSLVGFHPDWYYRAFRFRPVQPVNKKIDVKPGTAIV